MNSGLKLAVFVGEFTEIWLGMDPGRAFGGLGEVRVSEAVGEVVDNLSRIELGSGLGMVVNGFVGRLTLEVNGLFVITG